MSKNSLDQGVKVEIWHIRLVGGTVNAYIISIVMDKESKIKHPRKCVRGLKCNALSVYLPQEFL